MKIVHLDGQFLFSEGISSLIKTHHPSFSLFSVTNGYEALALIDNEKGIDLILMDLEVPDIDGFSMLEAISKRGLSIPVVVLSSCDSPWDIRSIMEAGAVGFVSKANEVRQLLDALKIVMEEDVVYLSDEMKVAIGRLPEKKPLNQMDRLLVEYNISVKQFEVLKLMHKGYNNAEIASIQNLSINTIKSHTSALFVALGVNDRLKCVIRAGSLGLLSCALRSTI